MNKKAQINQVFVYVFSVIVVLFVGYIVIKFLFSFNTTSEEFSIQKFYDTIDADYQKVYQTQGSQKVLDYKVSNQIQKICFIDNSADCITDITTQNNFDSEIQSSLNTIHTSGDNIVLFDSDGIKGSYKIGEFQGCFCEDINSGKFTLTLENKRNTIEINRQ